MWESRVQCKFSCYLLKNFSEADTWQVCRFHFNRGMSYHAVQNSFDDEVQLDTHVPTLWRDAGYEQGSWWHYPDGEHQARYILRYAPRTYCRDHLRIEKSRLMNKLAPGKLPGPYCTCNIYERFIKRWMLHTMLSVRIRSCQVSQFA